MTVAEFLAWPADPTGRTWQLVDGQPIPLPPASETHGAIVAGLCALVGNHLRRHRQAGRAVAMPGISPRAGADRNVRVPALAVTRQPPSLARHLLEQPMLVVEVLSQRHEAQAWDNAMAYCTMPSLRDILVVRSWEIGAELLTRQEDGTWPRDFTQAPSRVRLSSIDAEFDLADFYATTEFARPTAP